jgi:hypothetical protein
MSMLVTRLFGPRRLLIVAAIAIGSVSAAYAAPVQFTTVLTGPNESPPVASAGTGTATVDIDNVAHTLHLIVAWSGLTGNTTASHIHAATALAGAGTAGVATTTPYFAGFPIGVKFGLYEITLDMTLASSYNPSYVTAHGGNTTQAETDLFQAISDGKAYLNIHSTFAGGGEIRGFLVPASTPTTQTTWGRIKSMYR